MINCATSRQHRLPERSAAVRQGRSPFFRPGRACRWSGFAWLTAAILLLVAPCLRAETNVSVIATDPTTEVVLGRGQPFYVRIAFETDQPVGIWARPYGGGKPIKRYFSNVSASHVGAGEALGWFSLDEAAEVDEVRIFVGGGQPWREWRGRPRRRRQP